MPSKCMLCDKYSLYNLSTEKNALYCKDHKKKHDKHISKMQYLH